MASYSKKLKESIIAKMMPPQNRAVSDLARETGIPKPTLYTWRKKARENGFVVPSGQTKSEHWSTQDKFHIVLETATLSEIKLAKYCREKGLKQKEQEYRKLQKAIELIKEAVQAEEIACKEIGISQRTLQRWLAAKTLQDQRQVVKRPVPKNKLTEEERDQILDIVNQKRFQSLPPSQIVPTLADEGIYIASESTFYRVW